VDSADLRDLIAALPSGLQTRAGENGSILSGGEGQRVRMARALLRRDARLVIMDEPFRGLDRSQRKRLLAAARKWWLDATVICITHDMDVTTRFDRVVVMDRGRIVEQGDPQKLMENAQSAYVSMLRSERLLEEELFGATHWRRLRLNEGGLSSPEAQEPAP
jgi:ABC-type transport system involved in cytochrome bd biosynthesis fused ATPase/permease subunit